jgi:hypothetical protein
LGRGCVRGGRHHVPLQWRRRGSHPSMEDGWKSAATTETQPQGRQAGRWNFLATYLTIIKYVRNLPTGKLLFI